MEKRGLEPKKLNIFQRMKKKKFIKEITIENAYQYFKLHERLRQDPDIMNSVMEMDPRLLIDIMPFEVQESYVSEHPELITSIKNYSVILRMVQNNNKLFEQDLTNEIKLQLINDLPEIIKIVEDYDIFYDLVYEGMDNCLLAIHGRWTKFLEYLPMEVQNNIFMYCFGFEEFRGSDEMERLGNGVSIIR